MAITLTLSESVVQELVRASETNVITSRSVIPANTRAGDALLAARLRHNRNAEVAHEALLNEVLAAIGQERDVRAIRLADEQLRARVERIKDPALRAECLAMF